MKIMIKNERLTFSIGIPTRLLFSRIGLHIFNCKIKSGTDSCKTNISPDNLKKIRKCIKEMRRVHKNAYLLEAYDTDGGSVRIKL